MTLHKFHFYLALTTRARAAIEGGDFAEMWRSFMRNYFGGAAR